MFCLETWGLDENGYFRSGDEAAASVTGLLGWVKKCVRLGQNAAAESSDGGSVAERVLLDLKGVHARLLAEEQLDSERPRSDKEKGQHLLFLFQRDLLPGVSGKILESKGQRDNIAVRPVSWEAKAASWVFIGALNVGMLFYILLFAVSQTEHRQGAWALSFALWLVVEILFVSSATVIFTHVFIPSLIMKDVTKIKAKLVESIRAFNTSMRRKQGGGAGTDGPGSFNAASYLFVSTRLAEQWSELREAQIIAQFRTPWPKQSYQRETDVSQNYSKKYTALYRSASIIAIFFLTNLLQIPPALQDMVVQMCTTAAIGYTVLLHIDLYGVHPALVILPTLGACLAVYLAIRSSKARAKARLERLLLVDEVDDEGGKPSASSSKADVTSAVHKVEVDEYGDISDLDEDDNELRDMFRPIQDVAGAGSGAVTQLHQPMGHTTRKQSVQFGLQVLDTLRQETASAVVSHQDAAVAGVGAVEHKSQDQVEPVKTSPLPSVQEGKAAEVDEDWLSVSSESLDGAHQVAKQPTTVGAPQPAEVTEMQKDTKTGEQIAADANDGGSNSDEDSDTESSGSDSDEEDHPDISIAIPSHQTHALTGDNGGIAELRGGASDRDSENGDGSSGDSTDDSDDGSRSSTSYDGDDTASSRP